MRRLLSWVLAGAACTATTPYTPPVSNAVPLAAPGRSADALAAFDGMPNGMVDLATHRADQIAFDKQEEIPPAWGRYNAHSCRDCHENPVAGGGSQVTELRAGHLDAQGNFVFPEVRIGGGSVVVRNRTLINDKAICPGLESPEGDAQQHLPESENIRALRIAVSMLGDGYVEAVPTRCLEAIARWQCSQPELGACAGRRCGSRRSRRRAPCTSGGSGGRAEHASVPSFAADAFLNEMGITTALLPTGRDHRL